MNPASLQLPFKFDQVRLLHDLQICEKELWMPHYNSAQYEGTWNSISLRSASGQNQDITSFANTSYQDTPLLHKCKYFQEIVNLLECDKEAVRLLRLSPKSEIKEHTDNETSYEEGFFRLHIPILTNEAVIFKVNGEIIPMKHGECWYANFQLPHSVVNGGDEARVHLVIDCLRNEWSDLLFAQAGYILSPAKSPTHMEPEMTRKVIDELRLKSDIHSLNLADQLEKSLQNTKS
jgi:hypothetical protein